VHLAANSCIQQHTAQDKACEYFLEQEYSFVDTIKTVDGQEKLMFVFEHEQNSEKVYISGDTISHVYGNFDNKGTLWADEYIKYLKNGRVIDDESFFVHVLPSEETYIFTLFAPKSVSFILRKYEIINDSLGKIILETEPTRKHQINNSQLVGGAVAVVFTETIIENGEEQKMMKEIFFDRQSKASNQKLFKYLKDPKLEKLNGTSRHLQQTKSAS